MRIFLILGFTLLLGGCNGDVSSKEILPPQHLHIKDQFSYLISLEGFFAPEEIKWIHSIEPRIKYLLASGYSAQRQSDRYHNFKNAKEFVDIPDKNFRILKKIKFGGTFLSDAVVLDVVESSKKELFVTFAIDRNFD